jgi:ornithine cyclodeaminase
VAFLVLTHADVERLLSMEACIGVMEEALAALARGDLSQPLRSVYAPPGAPGVMAWMPAYRAGEDGVFGMKILCVIPSNPSRGLDGHQGAVMLMDGVTGQLRGLVDASAVTAMRTAAVSAVATRLLARENARELAIIGTGVQARRHLEAIPLVRPIERIRVASRTLEGTRRFVEELRPHVRCSLEAAASAEEAVHGADVVVTATTARDPVLERAWLGAGTHVNAVGASRPPHREIDTATWAAAAAFADRRESVEGEAADYRQAREEGAIGPGHIRAEIGEVLIGRAPGRTGHEEITLFRSLGLAVEDVATAQYLVRRAQESGVGTRVEF